MNITNYRSKSSNPLAAALANANGGQIPNTAAATAMPVSTTGGFAQANTQALNQRMSAG